MLWLDLIIHSSVGFRTSMLKTLSSFQHSKDGGLLITSCYIHCQTWMTSTWHSSNSPRINNKVEVFINHLPNLHFWILIWHELRWCCPHWNCCSILLCWETWHGSFCMLTWIYCPSLIYWSNEICSYLTLKMLFKPRFKQRWFCLT